MDSNRFLASLCLSLFATIVKRSRSTCEPDSAHSWICSKMAETLCVWCSLTLTASRLSVSPMYTCSHTHVYLYTKLLCKKRCSLCDSFVDVEKEGSNDRSFDVEYAKVTHAKSLGIERFSEIIDE